MRMNTWRGGGGEWVGGCRWTRAAASTGGCCSHTRPTRVAPAHPPPSPRQSAPRAWSPRPGRPLPPAASPACAHTQPLHPWAGGGGATPSDIIQPPHQQLRGVVLAAARGLHRVRGGRWRLPLLLLGRRAAAAAAAKPLAPRAQPRRGAPPPHPAAAAGGGALGVRPPGRSRHHACCSRACHAGQVLAHVKGGECDTFALRVGGDRALVVAVRWRRGCMGPLARD